MDELGAIDIRQGEKLCDLHRNGYKIIQNPSLFCFGQDAVLLSWFARAKRGERVLDLCTGNGIVPILMSAKNGAQSYEGLELLPESVCLARRSVELNGLSCIINITEGNVKDANGIYSAPFDVITVNPPYMNSGGGIPNPEEPKAIARHELKCTLEDIISVSAKLLRFGGRFYIVHRPRRLTDLFYYMRLHKIEPKKLLHVCPKKGKPPVLALVEGARGGKPFLKVLPELIVYNEDNSYTKEVMDIYYSCT